MVKENIKVVIGANFGDEGKGLMTDYFCHQSALRGENCIVVCHNGGAQRGHTVDTPDGLHHVFHHFGSGTFAGADTYLATGFILNPIIFCQEYEKLWKFGYKPIVYVNPFCKVTTPFDMIVNQILEEHRSNNRHGSCGMGIFETIERYRKCVGVYVGALNKRTRAEIEDYLKDLREVYIPLRFAENKITVNKEWEGIIKQENLIKRYIEDLCFMLDHTIISDDRNSLHNYKNIVFEGGQGLLLDQNNTEYFPNLTPSNTGLKNPAEMILRLFTDSEVEICYVTRPYLTRHGAGRLDNECRKEQINPNMEDLTNVPNPHQGILRYGKIDVSELVRRIQKDFSERRNWKLSISITHEDEVSEIFDSVDNFGMKDLTQNFDIIYQSFGKTRESILQAI